MKVFIKHNKPTSIPGLYKESLKTGIHGKRAARYISGTIELFERDRQIFKKSSSGAEVNQ